MSRAADEIIDLYERNASAWDEDRRRNRPVGEPGWIARFLRETAESPDILDVGCGSGEPIARDLIAAGCAVVGVDSSRSLIQLCRRRFPDHAWIAADMRNLDLGRRFGGVIAWHSLFHLRPDDQRRMVEVLARHMAPGGPLMFTSGGRCDETIGEWRGEALYHASLDPDDYSALLDEAGFSLIEHVADDLHCGGATIWLAKFAR